MGSHKRGLGYERFSVCYVSEGQSNSFETGPHVLDGRAYKCPKKAEFLKHRIN